MKGEIAEPFIIYTVLPRSAIPFSSSPLASVDVDGALLTCEVDSSVNFFQFYNDLVGTVSILCRS